MAKQNVKFNSHRLKCYKLHIDHDPTECGGLLGGAQNRRGRLHVPLARQVMVLFEPFRDQSLMQDTVQVSLY